MWGSQGWNQWALQPAMFNDVPHEQIDWAELAKQWIQMQQTQPSDARPPAPPPPPPQVAPPPVSAPPPPPPGHGPLIPDEFPDGSVSSIVKPSGPPASIPEPYPSDRNFKNESGSYLPKAADNSFWSKSEWEASAVSDVDERLWSTPPLEPAATLIGGKETFDYGHMHDNPPLAMQSIDYNHMSEFPYNQMYPTPAPVPAPETHYDQYWSQVNAAPTISPMFLKKERVTASLPVEEESTQIGELTMQMDAAKRKQLPAWIRDGLEKMEQERLKRLEKERAAKESAEKIAKSGLKKKDLEINNDSSSMALPVKSKFESDSEGEEEANTERIVKNSSPVLKQPPSPVEDLRTEEEKKQDLMLKVRRMLTEVLLSVTNSEMVAIAQEMYRKAASKAPARQLASATSLTSVASGLRGLASYGTESEASEAEEEPENSDSEEELYRKIKEKKRLFAVKERKIIADIERRELEEKMNAERALNDKNEKKFNMEIANAEKIAEAFKNSNNVGPTAATPPLNEISEGSPSEVAVSTEELNDGTAEETETEISKPEEILGPPKKDETNSSDSSSSSSDHSGEVAEKGRKQSRKEGKKSKSDSKKVAKRDKSSSKHSSRHKRSKSRDSSSSGKHKRERSRDKSDRKNSSYKKKKKYKRSDSSSSSGSSSHRKRHSSKYESSHGHRDRRSRSYEDRKRRRSVSPSGGRRRSDGHSSRSHRYEEEKHGRRHKSDKRYRHSPSPGGHSSKLPRKYRSSRSISSESESSGKKSKKSRNH